MPIGETKTCTTHTKEKERLGICCQEDQEKAEQQTYEHTIRTPHTGSSIVGIIKNERR
tara:strand:+ start:310 stop:483 length:174 start_codon:yes stop_codon:yes gene_type:complete